MRRRCTYGPTRISRPIQTSPNARGDGSCCCRQVDPETLAIWQQLIDISLAGFDAAYARMGVLLTDADLAGRACTTTTLHRSSRSLSRVALAVVDDGALVVFVEGFNAPMIVRKSDGGFGYGATGSGSGQAPGAHLAGGPVDLRGGRGRSHSTSTWYSPYRAKQASYPTTSAPNTSPSDRCWGPMGRSSPLARERP